jgi:hypothetical protein
MRSTDTPTLNFGANPWTGAGRGSLPLGRAGGGIAYAGGSPGFYGGGAGSGVPLPNFMGGVPNPVVAPGTQDPTTGGRDALRAQNLSNLPGEGVVWPGGRYSSFSVLPAAGASLGANPNFPSSGSRAPPGGWSAGFNWKGPFGMGLSGNVGRAPAAGATVPMLPGGGGTLSAWQAIRRYAAAAGMGSLTRAAFRFAVSKFGPWALEQMLGTPSNLVLAVYFQQQGKRRRARGVTGRQITNAKRVIRTLSSFQRALGGLRGAGGSGRPPRSRGRGRYIALAPYGGVNRRK